MHSNIALPKRSSWSNDDGDSSSGYNPFRELKRWTNPEQDASSQNKTHLPPPSPKTTTQEDTPNVVGQLFSSSELRQKSSSNNDSSNARPVVRHPIAREPYGSVDEEKSTVFLAKSEPRSTVSWPYDFSSRLRDFAANSSSGQPNNFSGKNDARGYQGGNRKRRVIVVEYGNTDELAEGKSDDYQGNQGATHPSSVTSETVRQSWNDPIYSEMVAPGYPIDENGHHISRHSSSLGKPLKESLRKVCVSICVLSS